MPEERHDPFACLLASEANSLAARPVTSQSCSKKAFDSCFQGSVQFWLVPPSQVKIMSWVPLVVLPGQARAALTARRRGAHYRGIGAGYLAQRR